MSCVVPFLGKKQDGATTVADKQAVKRKHKYQRKHGLGVEKKTITLSAQKPNRKQHTDTVHIYIYIYIYI